jgi:D-glycero-D-manno-heptose 1,7-bisphosphate phosphatase
MTKAVFLDRDGVLVSLVYHPASGQYEPPHAVTEFSLCPGVVPALCRLRAAGYALILVSNQPDYAKGKATREALDAVHRAFIAAVSESGVDFAACYYCYHHPAAVVPALRQACRCRKPGTLFVEEAHRKFDLVLPQSWFIGDSDVDIQCGRRSGMQTIMIENPHSAQRRPGERADVHVADLSAAAAVVCAAAVSGR